MTGRWIGAALVLLGVLMAVFSEQVVFPGLEWLLGIETIVGKENVVYQADGSYMFTNPTAMMRWIMGVRACGVLVGLCGLFTLLTTRVQDE